MYSQSAYVMTDFVLPYGATSGLRLVFDGTNGRILGYDANDNLVAAFAIVAGADQDGQAFPAGISSVPPGPFLGTGACVVTLDPGTGQLVFSPGPGQSALLDNGAMYAGNPNGSDNTGAYLFLTGPSSSPAGAPQLWMRAPSKDGVTEGWYFELGPSDYTTDRAKADAAVFATPGVHYGKTSDGGVPAFPVLRKWKTLSLNAPWVAYSQTPQVRRGPDGMVSVRGWASGGTPNVGSQVATLPADCRPGQRLIFWVAQPDSATVSNRCIVEPTGAITIDGGTGTSVALNLPPFYAADVQ